MVYFSISPLGAAFSFFFQSRANSKLQLQKINKLKRPKSRSHFVFVIQNFIIFGNFEFAHFNLGKGSVAASLPFLLLCGVAFLLLLEVVLPLREKKTAAPQRGEGGKAPPPKKKEVEKHHHPKGEGAKHHHPKGGGAKHNHFKGAGRDHHFTEACYTKILL